MVVEFFQGLFQHLVREIGIFHLFLLMRGIIYHCNTRVLSSCVDAPCCWPLRMAACLAPRQETQMPMGLAPSLVAPHPKVPDLKPQETPCSPPPPNSRISGLGTHSPHLRPRLYAFVCLGVHHFHP